MKPSRTRADPERQAQIIAELRRDAELRQKSYRDRALKIHPHVCARCAREFSGKRLRELTVHHKDHNFRNNPPDGSNWELLCLYCHDDEHEKFRRKICSDGSTTADGAEPSVISTPFEGLDALLKAPCPDPDPKQAHNGPQAKEALP
jgi:hypothetical protein